MESKKEKKLELLFPPGFEPGTFRVLGECHDQLDHRNSDDIERNLTLYMHTARLLSSAM